MRKYFSLILLSLIITQEFALGQKITYQKYIKTSDSEINKVSTLFENYVRSKPDSIYDNPYWNYEEKQKYNRFDFLESSFHPSLFMGFPIHILSIKSNQGLYEIKAQFSYCEDDGSPYVLAIVNYYAKKFNGEYKLLNGLNINRNKWKHTSFGLVDYFYPEYHQFNGKKAESLHEFIEDICKNLEVEPINFEYYMADDFHEIQQLLGFDYWFGMGGELKPEGRGGLGKLYAAGLGENYYHEAFHVQIDPHYKNKHNWISEGMATFLGGSRGHSLDWHIKRTSSHLEENQDIDLNNLLDHVTLDEYTEYRYVLGGLICKRVFEKGGWDLIKEFMQTGKTDEEFYHGIEACLGVKRSELNAYLRNELKKG